MKIAESIQFVYKYFKNSKTYYNTIQQNSDKGENKIFYM